MKKITRKLPHNQPLNHSERMKLRQETQKQRQRGFIPQGMGHYAVALPFKGSKYDPLTEDKKHYEATSHG